MIRIMKSKLVFSILVFFASQTMVIASGGHDRDRDKSLCDVVSLNGTGKMLEDGRIVGTEKSIEVEFVTTPLGALEVDQATGAVTLAAPNGDTVILNSLGKLCKVSGNNQ